jgi:hypothetical protein
LPSSVKRSSGPWPSLADRYSRRHADRAIHERPRERERRYQPRSFEVGGDDQGAPIVEANSPCIASTTGRNPFGVRHYLPCYLPVRRITSDEPSRAVRQVHRHPHCAGCHFDLIAVRADVSTGGRGERTPADAGGHRPLRYEYATSRRTAPLFLCAHQHPRIPVLGDERLRFVLVTCPVCAALGPLRVRPILSRGYVQTVRS